MKIRTRFAPSPTGFLHIGSVRTALYNWLFARHWQGEFILRIEDTDLVRSTPESVQAILRAMDWLDLQYDAGPYYQTQRFDRYRAVAEQLLAEGKAYRCYCSKERLEKLREEQLATKQKPKYDGKCRHLHSAPSDTLEYVIRFKNPEQGTVKFNDLIRGPIEFSNAELDDLIIMRNDGSPTYNFTVVVDDWDMQITHVIRGDDHINNTPRQINILLALGAELPIYGHIPMILGSDGKRLSKREGAADIMEYRALGFLPVAVLNYLVRLGWSHGDQEIFNVAEMVNLFDGKNINNSPAALNPQKLVWLNQHYLKTLEYTEILPELTWHLERANLDLTQGPELRTVFELQKERCKTLVELVERSKFFYTELSIYPSDLVAQHWNAEVLTIFQQLCNEFQALTNWEASAIHEILHKVALHLNLKLGKIAQPLRLALTGDLISPPIDATLAVLGKAKTLARLEQACDFLSRHSSGGRATDS